MSVARIAGMLLLMIFGVYAEEENRMDSVHDLTINSIDGEPVKLSQYRGKVLLIVNVASRCGLTGQYAGLQELFEKYQQQGFTVLGFPANNFHGQEPGTDSEIKQFCTLNYGVTFPLFSKLSVKGDDQHPLYAYLTSEEIHPQFGGEITWNFNKFLVSSEGKIIGRFGSQVAPMDETVLIAIEQALAGPSPDDEG